MVVRMMRFPADEKAGLAVPKHLRAAHPAEGPKGSEHVDSFQDVGFALGVVSEQQMKSGGELGIEPPIIAKITQPKLAQVHAELCGRAVHMESNDNSLVS